MSLPKHNHSLALLLALLFFISLTCSAQVMQDIPDRYYVEHFGEEEGLPQNSINNILLDKNDFLWIATEGGITRFNGNRFLPVSVKAGVNSSKFTRVKGFYYKGKDTIVAYSAANSLVAIIVNNTIVAVEKFQRSIHGFIFSNIQHSMKAPAYFGIDNADAILQEWNLTLGSFTGTVYNKDSFMVTLNDGVGIYDARGPAGKIKIDKLVYRRLLYVNQQPVYIDADNYVNFYSTAGLTKRQRLTITPYKNELKFFNNGVENNFFCIADSVLYRIDITTGGVLQVKKILNNLEYPMDIQRVYEKDNNTIVVGTARNGLFAYKKQLFSITEQLPDKEPDGFYVQQLLPDSQTILTGLDKLFRNGRYIGKASALAGTHNYSSLKDSKGNYWYVYFDKVLRVKGINAKPVTMMTFKGSPGIFFEDAEQRVWFSSATQFGYFKNDIFIEVSINNLNRGLISYMQQDVAGRYLIGTREGLYVLNSATESLVKEVPAFKTLDIRFLWPEPNGQTWVCTYGQGLFLMAANGEVTTFPESSGRLAYVHCIIEDTRGNFWMPTNSGLLVTSRQSLMTYSRNKSQLPFFYRFSKTNGLRTNEFNGGTQPAYLRLPNGDISLASMQGLVRFHPDTIDFRFSASPIVIDNIHLDSVEVLTYDSMQVANNVNNISFGISSSFWGQTGNDQLEYQVVGKGKTAVDSRWLPVDESGKINLFSPSYGDYLLIVRKRKGLQGSDYIYKTVGFTVQPKWYQTRAFYTARGLLFLLLLIGIFFWRRNYYRNANRVLTEKVAAATTELQQVNNTLEKKVEERTVAIQEAEVKFRTLVERSLAGVYIVQDQKYVYVNPRFEEILGYDAGELLGTKGVKVIREDLREMVNEKARKRITGELTSERYETTGVKKDGTEVQLEFFGTRTIYEGKPTIIGTMLDITERKQMETELIEAEQKFRDLVEKSLVGVYIIRHGKFAYVNPRFAEIFGYTQEELVEGPPVSIVVYEPDKELVASNIRERMSGQMEGLQYAIRGIKKDGTVIHAEMFGRTTVFENGPAIIGTLLDITEKKLAEEQLIKEKDLSQSIINNLPGVFYIFDQDGHYHLWNKNHETVTGYTSEEMNNMHPAGFIEEADLPVLGERIKKVFKEGYAELETLFVTKDGRKIPYYFNGVSITYNDQPCLMGVGIDISERKKAEAQLMIEKDLSQSIINGLPGVFFIFDENRTHLLWNKNFETVTGYSSEELKGKMAGMCVEEKDIPVFTKAIEKMHANGHAEVEVTLVNKYKTKIPFYVNGIAITYEGKPCILGIGIDISERKNAEKEKEKANYLLNERIKELTTLYRVGLVLQREQRTLLVTLQDVVSVLPAGWQYPDITAASITFGELEFVTANFSPGPFSQSASFITGNGTVGKIEVVYLEERPQEDEGPFLTEERKLLDMLGDMLRIYFTRREATEALQKSEANLHTIFDTTDTVYALTDINYKLIAFNQRAFDFGRKEFKKTFQLHTSLVDYFPENRRAVIAENIEMVAKGSHISYEVSYPQEDGKLNWYYVRMFPITNAQKIVFGMMMAISDITEKKLLEQEILDQRIQEQKMVTRAILIGEEKERNKIGQELHDNINQILAGTKLYLGMARKAKDNREQIINESMALIDSAIEEIRTFSRGKVTPMKKVDLEELLRLLVEAVSETTSISTRFVYKGNGQFIEDDLKLNIYRITQEQLNNILKHAMAKNISVEVEAGAEHIHLLVTDDGKGFDINAKKKGIGLINIINRVESFNGTILIQSTPGNGCRTAIRIPFEKREHQEIIS